MSIPATVVSRTAVGRSYRVVGQTACALVLGEVSFAHSREAWKVWQAEDARVHRQVTTHNTLDDWRIPAAEKTAPERNGQTGTDMYVSDATQKCKIHETVRWCHSGAANMHGSRQWWQPAVKAAGACGKGM